MKKHLFPLFTAASMLFATSCSEEENFAESNKQSVTFKVEVEGTGATSRTIADGITVGKGQMVDKLFYAVYESDPEKKSNCLWEGEAIVSNGVATVVIPLVNGLHYDLVFLAYNKGNNAFGIERNGKLTFSGNLCADVDLTDLTLRDDLDANQEAYDAFYHVESNYVTNTSSTTPVKLKRMFAQLNVATTDQDLSNAKQLGADIIQSAITLKKVPNKFNARTGGVDGETTVTFAGSNILKCSQKSVGQVHENEQLTIEMEGQDKNFNYLAMAYVLAGTQSSLHDIGVSFYRPKDTGVELVYTRPIASVPLQRQYRTNITGSILTQQEAFSVSLDTDFGNYNESVGDVVVVGTAEGLQKAIENAQPNVSAKIKLSEDLILGVNSSSIYSRTTENATLIIDESKIIVLDLNGHNLSYAVTNDGASAIINNKGILDIINTGENKDAKLDFVAENPDTQDIPSYATNTITNTGTLTIGENVTVNNVSEGSASYAVDNHGVFTLNGGTLIGKRCALRVAKYNQDNVKFTMNSGLIKAFTPAWIQLPGSNNADAPSITVDINGGTMMSIKESSAENDVMYTYSHGNSHANTTIKISGGNFVGGTVSIGAGYKGDAPTLNITGGTFEYDVLQWLENDEYKVVYSARTEISTAEDLLALGGKSVVGTYFIVNDIDLAGAAIPTIGAAYGKSLTIIGNGHTISNAVTAHTAHNGMKHHGLFYAYTNSELTIKDLVIENVIIDATKDTERNYGAAVVVAFADGGSIVTLNNVDVKNCKVLNNVPELGDEAGVYVGYQTGTLNMTDCNSTGCSVVGETEEKTGAFIGMVNGTANLINCTTDLTIGVCNRVAGTLNIDGTVHGKASNQDELNKAAASGNNVLLTLGSGEYILPIGTKNSSLTIIGTKETVIDVTKGSYIENTKLTFEGITIKTSTGNVMDENGNQGTDYAALYSKDVTYLNCNFIGPMRIGRDGAKFIGCTFSGLGNDYVWTNGNDVTFEECTFNTDGKAILIYSDGGNEVSEVSVKNCTFNATTGAKSGAIANQNCAAIEIHNYGNGVNLTTSGNTYDSNFSGEWRIKTYEIGKTKVFVNGTEYTSIALDGKTMTIDENKNVTVNQ